MDDEIVLAAPATRAQLLDGYEALGELLRGFRDEGWMIHRAGDDGGVVDVEPDSLNKTIW